MWFETLNRLFLVNSVVAIFIFNDESPSLVCGTASDPVGRFLGELGLIPIVVLLPWVHNHHKQHPTDKNLMWARDFWWNGWVFPIPRLTGLAIVNTNCFTKNSPCVCHGTILRWRGDGEVECQGYSPDDTRWSFMEMTQHAWVATAPASVSTTESLCILRAVKRSGKFCTVRRQMFKSFLSVCRLFSLASFSLPAKIKEKKRSTQYRRRLCGFLGPADSSHPPLVGPSSSSGSQAARHGRIPKPVPVSCVPILFLRGLAIVSDVLEPARLFPI